MEERIFFTNSRKLKLAGVINNPTGDRSQLIAIIVHGHTAHKDGLRIIPITEMLVRHSISSFRIDLTGHGESEGVVETTTVSDAVDDVINAILHLKSLGYSKIGLIGSSFGGLACNIAASKTTGLEFLILRSPVSHYEDRYRDVEGTEFVRQWKKKGTRPYENNSRLRYSFYEDAIKHDGYETGSRIAIPTLIIHGDKDELVPVSQSIKLASKIKNSKLVLVKGADHRYSDTGYFKYHLQEMETFITQLWKKT